MKRSSQTIFAFLVAFGVLASAAQAADWPALPPACLPERVKQDQNPKLQGCQCPPASFCPQNYNEYVNVNLYKMPPALVNQCCPVMEPPKCEAGTLHEGKSKPSVNNDCDPVCAAGTDFAGQLVRTVPNQSCNKAAACPPKYYPSMDDSQTSNSANGYTYQTGNRVNFSPDPGASGYGAGWTNLMSTRYNYALRVRQFQEWTYGIQYCLMWNANGSMCFVRNGYSPISNGLNDGQRDLSVLAAQGGRDKMTWFGISVMPVDRLADNFVNDEAIAEFNGQDRIAIGDNSLGSVIPFEGGGDANRTQYPIGPKLSAQAPQFFDQCNKVGGEYVELEYKNVDGKQCGYLQCRYVYSPGATESCLAGDTKVTLADGSLKPVTELKIGDLVKGSDGAHKIIASNTYQSGLRVMYGINGSGALLTGDHPIRTKAGWKVINPEAVPLYADKPGFAKDALAVGDVLVTEKGEVVVKSIDRRAKVDPVTTYNIKVDGNAGFFANGYEVKGFDKMEMHYE